MMTTTTTTTTTTAMYKSLLNASICRNNTAMYRRSFSLLHKPFTTIVVVSKGVLSLQDPRISFGTTPTLPWTLPLHQRRPLLIQKQQQQQQPVKSITQIVRNVSNSMQNFKPQAPESLTVEIAEGILDLTHFYCKFGISGQQFRHIATIPDLPTIERWQRMMEIYVTTQIHVVAGLGYPANEEGLNQYALHLAEVIAKTDDTMKELFAEIRRDTWRGIVGTVFQINPKDIPVLPLQEARDLMYKVSNKMTDPDILLLIQSRTANVRHEKDQIELQMKHMILQQILVDEVYLGGSPSFVEENGFGTGPIGYAKVQCALSDHEGDAIMANYASQSMIKILSAAGIDIDTIEGPGLPSCNPV